MMGKRSLPLDCVSKEKQTHPLRLLPDSSSVLVRSQEARGVSLSLEPAGDRVGSGGAAPSAAGGTASRPSPRRDTPPEEPATSRPAGSVPWLGARACGTGRPPSPVETGVSEHLWVPLGVGPRKVHKKEQRLGNAGHPRGPRPRCPSPSVPPTGPQLPAPLISPGAESTSPPAADTAPEANRSQLLESREHLVTVVVLKPLRRRSHQWLRHVAASEQPAASSRRP